MKELFVICLIFLFGNSNNTVLASTAPSRPPVKEAKLLEEARSNFEPLVLSKSHLKDPVEKAKYELGKKLFFEKKLSLGNDISCNSCHQLSNYGVDNKATSPGHKGQRGDRSSPTVYNAFLHFSQFWDGRAKNLEEQALGPILNPIEMAMPSPDAVVKKLQNTENYVALFRKAFPKDKRPLQYQNVGKAIASFEKTLGTPSRFDAFLQGNVHALSTQEKRGLGTFMSIGCINCHDGKGVGGGSFQKLGAVTKYPTKDLGRYNVTKDEDDKYVFKVPTLRNVEKTGPYFHDGHVKTLKEAVKLMARHQLGEELKDNQVEDVMAFLKSLTGKLPKI